MRTSNVVRVDFAKGRPVPGPQPRRSGPDEALQKGLRDLESDFRRLWDAEQERGRLLVALMRSLAATSGGAA